MTWANGYASFRLEVELIVAGDGTGVWDTSVWGTGTWSGDEPNWVDATSYVLQADTRTGRNRFIIGDFDVATATFVLDNDSGTWAPFSGVTSIGEIPIRPGAMVRLSGRFDGSEHDGALTNLDTWTGTVDESPWTVHGTGLTLGTPTPEWLPMWTGRVHDLMDRFDAAGTGAVVVVKCVGMLQDLAAYNPEPLGIARIAESPGARIGYLLDEAFFPSSWRDLDTGVYTVEASTLPGNFLEEARVAARADGGDVYAGRDGHVVFRDGNWLLQDPRSATVQYTLGDTRHGISDASTRWSLQRIYNDLHYTNTATTVTASDSASQSQNGIRSLRRTILNNNNTDLQTLCTRDVGILENDQIVIESVSMQPDNVFQTAAGVFLDIGDLVSVTVTTNGWSYVQDLHVAGVSHTITPDDWTVTFRVDSREGATILT